MQPANSDEAHEPDWTSPDRNDAYRSWRSPGASHSVTLWDEVAPELPRAMADHAEFRDDSSES